MFYVLISDHVVLVGYPNALALSVILVPRIHELTLLIQTRKWNVSISLGHHLLVSQRVFIAFIEFVSCPFFFNKFLHDSNTIDLGVHFENIMRFGMPIMKTTVCPRRTVPKIDLKIVFFLILA